MTNLVGQTLGKYHLVALLGQGGMAEVYKAYQPGLNRYVAIKVLHSHMAEDKDFIGRFEREANAVARLRHPNVLQVYDFDSEGERHYMVMEYVEGPTLKAELQERTTQGRGFSPVEAARLFTPLAHAIDYAHARGMIHRDLKPANIMFNAEGQVVLTDFGIALIVGSARYTMTGAITGTPAYMSPEQGQGQPGDARSDLYSLGVILYEMLTGRVPFDADAPVAIIMRHLNEPPPFPTALNPDVPEAVEQMLLKALSKSPEDRYQSAGQLAKALRDALGLSTEQILTALPALSLTPMAAPTGVFVEGALPPNPYRGLFAFREEDAPLFFGREDFADQLVEGIRDQPLVAVIGPSGSGKSSVVFAGLLPRLRPAPPPSGSTARPTQQTPPAGTTPSSTPRPTTGKAWLIADFRPGPQPFHALADALVPLLEPQMSETDRLVETRKLADALQRGDLGLLHVVKRILQKAVGQVGNLSSFGQGKVSHLPYKFLLVADQFHELYTLCPDPDLRRRFLDVLLDTTTSTQTPALTLLLTLRDDFLGQASAHHALTDALRSASLTLGPLTRPELRRAIESPAAKQGVSFEPGLVERMIDDVSSQATGPATGAGQSLPLLEFALTSLWERQHRRQMTHAAYDEIGRVEGALARHADEVYDGLSDNEKELARRVLVQMVRPGEGTGDTRRLATRAELGEAGWELAQKLADARLVVTSRDPTTGQETAEVIHDALIRSWGQLREWMEAQRPFRTWQERLRVALRQWDASSLNESALLYGAPLAEAEGWLAERQADLSPAEKAYILASLTLRERAEAEREAQRQRELEAAQRLAETEKQRAEEQARAVEAAQKLAQTEKQRAEEQGRAARGLQRAAWLMGIALVAILVLAFFAVQNAQQAVRNARAAQTSEARALAQQSTAQAASTQAVAQQSTAEAASTAAVAEAHSRATQEAIALDNFRSAEGQRLGALASSLVQSPGGDAELAALLSIRGLQKTYSPQADAALSQALSRLYIWQVFIGHTRAVWAAAVSPNGKYVATASEDRTVRLWDAETGRELRVFSGHTETPKAVAFSPDGKYLLTGGQDETARLWEIETGQELLTLHQTGAASAVAFAPDSQYLLTNNATATGSRIIVWVAQTGQEVRRFASGELLSDAIFSPDGRYVLATSDEIVRLFDIQTGQEIRQFDVQDIGSFFAKSAFSTTAKYLLIPDGEVARLYDLQTGQELHALAGHTGPVNVAAFSPDGQQAVTGSSDHTARLWNVETGQEIGIFPGHTDDIWSVAFSPDGKYILTGSWDGTARLWHIGPQTQPRTFTNPSISVSAAALSPDGNTVLLGSRDGTVSLRDVQGDAEARQFIGHTAAVNAAAFSFDGRYALTASDDRTARLWEVETGSVLQVLAHADPVFAAVFSADGKSIVTGSGDNTATLWDSESGQRRRGFTISSLFGVTLSPDGKYVLTGLGSRRNLVLWDALAGSQLRSLIGHTDTVDAVAFSPDGHAEHVLSGSRDQTARLWEIETTEQLHVFSGHSGAVLAVAFSPDGKHILTASRDHTARLWSAETGQQLRLFAGHSDEVTGVAFSPEGKFVLTVSADGTARLWDAGYHDAIRFVCTRLVRDLTDDERAQYGITDNEPTCPKP